MLDAARTVLPDLPKDDAAALAEHALRRSGEPHSALFAHVRTSVADARLVFYPLYVLRYRYAGEASEGSSIFFAALSGTTGKVVASRHPSAFKSVVGRLGRLFG